jgi:putative copper resistance protein D
MKRPTATYLLALCLALCGVAKAGPPDGKALYDQKCASCHGPKGLGDGQDAIYFDKPPTNLTLATYPHGTSDDEVFKVITDGLDKTNMQGFKDKLTDAERHALVDYLKTLRAPK